MSATEILMQSLNVSNRNNDEDSKCQQQNYRFGFLMSAKEIPVHILNIINRNTDADSKCLQQKY